MMQSNDYKAGRLAAVASLPAGATVWDLVWHPYRKLEAAGFSATLATVSTYAVALALAIAIFRRRLRQARIDAWLVAIALSAAGCNLAYVIAIVNGEVMRVLLLVSELAVAAIAARWLADEAMGVREWAGGALIVVAGLLSARLETSRACSTAVGRLPTRSQPAVASSSCGVRRRRW